MNANPKCGIYAIYCEAERLLYIGSSNYIPFRWSKHRVELKRGGHVCKKLQAAYNRNGFEGLRFLLLESVCEQYMLKSEQLFILASSLCDDLILANTNKAYTKSLGKIDGKPVTSRVFILNSLFPQLQNA